MEDCSIEPNQKLKLAEAQIFSAILGALRQARKFAPFWPGVVGLAALVIVANLHAAVALAPFPKTNLTVFLANWQPANAQPGSALELDPQWVGTVKRSYLRDPMGIYKDEPTNNIRFSHLVVSRDWYNRTNLIIFRGRVTAKGTLGSYRSDEAPVFMNNLPTTKAIMEAKDAIDLSRMFDDRPGSGLDGRSSRWTLFTLERPDRLRFLGVFASFSSESLEVTEGFFRPANPNSTVERTQFKTGEEMEDEYQAAKKQNRAKYPLPLRALLEARETPDDHDLIAYKRALKEVRRNPSPLLFRQFAEWIHEGTREIHGMLENVLFDMHLNYLELEKWEEPQRAIALKALADALPHVRTMSDLKDLLVLLLGAHGGGDFKLADQGKPPIIDLTVTCVSSGNCGYRERELAVLPEDLVKVAERCREALKERYPDLR